MVNKRRINQRRLPVGRCLLCSGQSRQGLLCQSCREDLPRLGSGCQYCARPLPQAAICPACQHRPPPYRAVGCYRYTYPLPALIQRMKYRGHATLAAELGELMAAAGRPGSYGDTCLIPMPLHWRRQCWRGFNQALELARPLAARLDVPLRTDLCRRIQPTRPQADLRGRERQQNVHQAFEVTTSPPLPGHVVLVDDVMTSGQTAAALARCLRRAGVHEITVWTLALASNSYNHK